MADKPERIILLKVPIDIVSPEELPDVFSSLLPRNNPESSQYGLDIVLLSLWDLLRARRKGEYQNYLLNAALIIPISKSIVSGAKFLTGKTVYRHMPFKFVISLLTFLEKQDQSLFILGSKGMVLKKAEKNIRSTFPNLRIVGRYEGSIKKKEEAAVIEAIRKSSPSLLLAGKGIRGRELWIYRKSNQLNQAIRLWCSDLLEVFAEKKRRPSDAVFEMGLENIGHCWRNPLKILRIFSFLRFKWLLLYYWLRGKRNAV